MGAYKEIYFQLHQNENEKEIDLGFTRHGIHAFVHRVASASDPTKREVLPVVQSQSAAPDDAVHEPKRLTDTKTLIKQIYG